MSRDACAQHRAMARNNAWSNHRLAKACGELSQLEFEARRVSFFPSIQLTLSHILLVDLYYRDALEGGGRGLSIFESELPFPELGRLAAEQRASDAGLIRFCDGLEPDALARQVVIDRGEDGLTSETVHAVLSHLFVHQIHHRGQVHSMLAGTGVAPPQLDEFFLVWDAPRRECELRELGLEARE